MTYLEQLHKLPPDIIEHFRKTGNSEAISEVLQEFILHIDAAARILRHEGNLTRAATKLRHEFPKLNFSTAKGRIYDALNFFYTLDHATSQSVWDNLYADRYEDLAKLCIADNKLEAARRNYDRSYELRSRATASNLIDIQAPIFIIDSNIKPEDLGYESKKMYEIARKDEAGEYVKMISGLNTTATEKKRILNDTDIKDVEFTEESEDGSN